MNDIAIDKEHLHYLEQLSEMYPTIGKASSEIINLQAILNLPKGTEHFVSDVHGEYEAFSHVLKNGSGAVRKKIEDDPQNPRIIKTVWGKGYYID